MKSIFEYTNNVSRQTFSAASIVDSKGKQVGKIIIRFTDSNIGYNHLVYVQLPGFVRGQAKGNTYNQPVTLFRLIQDNGFRCFAGRGREVMTYGDAESLSSFNDIASLKKGNRTYTINWVF